MRYIGPNVCYRTSISSTTVPRKNDGNGGFTAYRPSNNDFTAFSAKTAVVVYVNVHIYLLCTAIIVYRVHIIQLWDRDDLLETRLSLQSQCDTSIARAAGCVLHI